MKSHALFIFKLLTFFASFLILLVQPTDAQGSHGGGGGGHDSGRRHSHYDTYRNSSENCYNPANRNDIRLWNGTAPGAIGNDPCLDVPFLRRFPAKGGVETGKKNPPAILLIPGGGYYKLTNKKEQDPVAEYFASFGATTFILYYRLVKTNGTYRYPVPIQDGQRALKLIRAMAKDLGVDGQKVGVFGFSAGGHLATTISTHFESDFGLTSHDTIDNTNGQPDFLGFGYPVISMVLPSNSRKQLLKGYAGTDLKNLEKYLSGEQNVTPQMPPVFLFTSMDDEVITPQNSVLFQRALEAAKVPAEVHLFQHGIHGAGLATDQPEEKVWPELFQQWLLRNHFLSINK